jgi:NADPH:quinone reductase-like Zn-dependent oxidoreductase
MAKFSFIRFVRSQLSKTPPVPVADLTGKTVVVTGANIGLGFEAAKHFARMNPAKVVIACRSEAKGAAALAGKPHSIRMTAMLIKGVLRACARNGLYTRRSTIGGPK